MKQDKVILVLSDLHLMCNGRDNRIDILNEQHLLKSQILKVCKKYARPIIVLLGDVFDRGFRIPHRLGEEMSFFMSLCGHTEAIYSVVGNHEITYYMNNPFWNLVTEVKSDYLNSLSKNTAPLGAADIIKVQDTLDLDGLLLRFNHYNQPLEFAKDGNIEILFAHNSLHNEQLRSSSSGFKPVYIDTSKQIAPLSSYKLSFLGHMHWLYGVWDTEGGTIYGLGALGRPDITEIRDDYLERNIPAIIWNSESKTLSVENNLFNLLAYDECVNKSKFEVENKTQEYVSDLINSVSDVEFVSPLESLERLVSTDARLRLMLEDLKGGKNFSKDFLLKAAELVKRRDTL